MVVLIVTPVPAATAPARGLKVGVAAGARIVYVADPTAASANPGAVALALIVTAAVIAIGAVYGDLGVAVVDVPPDQMSQMSTMAAEDSGILAIEPERIVYALEMPLPGATTSNDYLIGYRDAVNHLEIGRAHV